MRCLVISFSSKPKETPTSGICLAAFSEYLRGLLLSPSIDQESLLTSSGVEGYDSVFESASPRNENLCWEDYFGDLFLDWHQLHFNGDPMSEQFSEQEIASVIQNFCSIAILSSESFFSRSQNVSLFLSITTEALENEITEPETANIVSYIKRRYQKFFDWIEKWTPLHVRLDRAQHYSTRVAFRYFVFEFMRRHPEASEELSKTHAWGTACPATKLWEFWTRRFIFARSPRILERLLTLDEVEAHNELNPKPKDEESEGWSTYFAHLIRGWQKLYFNESSNSPTNPLGRHQLHLIESSGAITFSSQETDPVLRIFCETAEQNQNCFFSLPQNISLFLSIVTEAQGFEVCGLGHRVQVIQHIKNRFSTFLEWMQTFTQQVLSVRVHDYSTQVAFRHFVFEFLIRYPKASKELSKTHEWETAYPAAKICDLWMDQLLPNSSQNVPTTDIETLLYKALNMNISFTDLDEFVARNESIFMLEENEFIDILLNLFRSWYPSGSFGGSHAKSDQELLSLISSFCQILFQHQTKDFDSTETVSLFLAVVTDPLLEPDKQLDAQIFKVTKKIKGQFPKFLKGLYDWTTKCLSSSHPNDDYSAIISSRYFIFEVLRRYPNASKYFHQEFGWESENPVRDLWKFWQESLSAKETKKGERDMLKETEIMMKKTQIMMKEAADMMRRTKLKKAWRTRNGTRMRERRRL